MEACCKALGLPLAEIDEQRECAYVRCELPECAESADYRIAVALLPEIKLFA
jgi:hypothetical protein